MRYITFSGKSSRPVRTVYAQEVASVTCLSCLVEQEQAPLGRHGDRMRA